MSKIGLAVLVFGFLGLTAVGANFYGKKEGRALCQKETLEAVQKRVIENDKKLRSVRANRPSTTRVADRLRDGTF